MKMTDVYHACDEHALVFSKKSMSCINEQAIVNKYVKQRLFLFFTKFTGRI